MSIPYFHTRCGLSANLECRFEICCTRFAENTGRKNRQKLAIWAPSHNILSGCISLQQRRASTIGKKLVKRQYLLHMSSQNMANFGPLTAEIGSEVWGTAANFNAFRVLPSLLQRRRSPEANQTLHDVWPSHWLVCTVYTFSGALAL